MSASFAFDAVPRHVPQSGKWASLVLTVLMHLVLALLLFFGVQWQRRPPEPVMVELVRSLPPLPAVEVPPPAVVTPPKPEVQKPEPIPAVKPDIAIKVPKPEPVKPKKEPVKPLPPPVQEKPKAIEKPKQVEKTKPEEKKPVPDTLPPPDRLTEMLKLEADRAKRQVQANESAASKASAADAARSTRGSDEWGAKIRNKVRGNIVTPPGVTGRPKATFAIQLLPTGEVMTVRLISSSGNKILDEAIERAINKSSPLPLPSRPELFQHELNLIFDPLGD